MPVLTSGFYPLSTSFLIPLILESPISDDTHLQSNAYPVIRNEGKVVCFLIPLF
jgi:hypothetical protein